jgi:ribosomal protein L7/L12
MWIFLGLVAVAFIILHKRSTEIITVNPLRPPTPASAAKEEGPTFAGVLGAIKEAAQEANREANKVQAAVQGRAAIIQMARDGQMIEAMQLYRRLYGVDLQTAKKAIDKILLER